MASAQFELVDACSTTRGPQSLGRGSFVGRDFEVGLKKLTFMHSTEPKHADLIPCKISFESKHMRKFVDARLDRRAGHYLNLIADLPGGGRLYVERLEGQSLVCLRTPPQPHGIPGAKSTSITAPALPSRSPSINRVVNAAIRSANIRAVAWARQASSRQTDLDFDALCAVLLRLPTRTSFFAAGRVCSSWHEAAHGTSPVMGAHLEWRAIHSTVSEIKQLAAGSPVTRQWLMLHADEAISSLTIEELSSMRATEDLLLRRLQRKPEEGIKMSLTDPTGAPLDPAPLTTLAEPMVLAHSGGRLVQVVVTIEPPGDGSTAGGSTAGVVRHRDRVVGYLKPLCVGSQRFVINQRGGAVLNVWGNLNWPVSMWAPSVVALPRDLLPATVLGELLLRASFVPCASFAGRLPGYVFKAGEHGPGYYRDSR